jgi:putative nucleotidyltransferase with HDIG domain
MNRIKLYIFNHFEQILILAVLLSVLFVHYFVLQKLAFLNFYYLPVLLAGFFLGRRTAVLFSFFCVLLVAIFVMTTPEFLKGVEGNLDATLSLTLWGSFLMLTSYIVGTLFKDKEQRIQDLRNAYMGVLEILCKYLESADRYTKGHSIRVANVATEVAIAMNLPRHEIENVKAAALLHDIGKVEISTDLIQKAAALDENEKKEIDSHSEKGAHILSSVGSVLKEAVPIVLAHHQWYNATQTEADSSLPASAKVGASIVAVADTYDAITSDRPYRAGQSPARALEEIENGSGRQFHPEVVKALKRVLSLKVDAFEDNIISVSA